MPPQLLAWISLGCFAAAAAIGSALLLAHARRVRVPLAGAFPHGLFALAGLITLLVAVITSWGEEEDRLGPLPVVSLVLLLGAAGAGVTLFYLHASTGSVPRWLGVAHGSTAGLGVLILLIAMIGQAWTAKPVGVDVDTRVNPRTAPPVPAERTVPAPTAPSTQRAPAGG